MTSIELKSKVNNIAFEGQCLSFIGYFFFVMEIRAMIIFHNIPLPPYNNISIK